jgi:hypothetical protein
LLDSAAVNGPAMAATAPSMIYVALVAVALTVGLGGMESCSQTREAEFPNSVPSVQHRAENRPL